MPSPAAVFAPVIAARPQLEREVNALRQRLQALQALAAALEHLREVVPTETFPAPRDQDCRYGCCKAGDMGLYSEAIPA